VSLGLSRGGTDGTGPTQRREGCFAAQPLWVLTSSDDQSSGNIETHTVLSEKAWGELLEQWLHVFLGCFDLGSQRDPSFGERVQSDTGSTHGIGHGAWPPLRGDSNPLRCSQPTKLSTDRLRGRQHQVLHLIRDCCFGFDR